MEAGRDLKLLNAGIEDAERSHRPRHAALKCGIDKEIRTVSLQSLLRGHSPADTLTLTQ